MGSTAGGPTWNRTVQGNPPTSLSSVGTAVAFATFTFQVTASDTYTIDVISTWDNYLHLYDGAFDPNSQFGNLLAANDDAGAGLNAQMIRNLTTGNTYVAVVSGYENTDFGEYSLSFSSGGQQGQAVPASVVPEPTTYALMSLGLMAMGVVHRRRRKA
jgi:hypothetical protein